MESAVDTGTDGDAGMDTDSDTDTDADSELGACIAFYGEMLMGDVCWNDETEINCEDWDGIFELESTCALLLSKRQLTSALLRPHSSPPPGSVLDLTAQKM